jgi:hypothetical protein
MAPLAGPSGAGANVGQAPQPAKATRLIDAMGRVYGIDLNFELLPFFGGDVASRLADLVLDLEDFGLAGPSGAGANVGQAPQPAKATRLIDAMGRWSAAVNGLC